MASRKALVVAINDYPGSANDLPSCVEDAKGITELLQSEPYAFEEVRTFTDGEATIKTVTEGLHWLFGNNAQEGGTQLTPEDRVVFYYSGHGFRTEKDGVLRECLCLYDGFFFDEELNKQTQGLPPGIFTMVLDSCHSGGMDKRFFETLSANGSSAEESVERVRVKTWMPAPEELVKLFVTEDASIPFKPFGCGTIRPRRTTAAGAKKSTGAATKVRQAKESAEAQVNGLMITACQADQTASASSSQTQGRSAFTFCLLNAYTKLGNDPASLESLSSDSLFNTVTQELAALQFKQTPVLIEPPNAPGLRSRSFLTLQPIAQAPAGASPASATRDVATSAPGKGFQPSATTTQSSPTNETTNQGDQPMAATQVSNMASTYAMSDSEEKMLKAVLPAVLPGILRSRMQDSPYNAAGGAAGQAPAADEKFWGQVIAAAISAAPGVINAVRGKEFQAATQSSMVGVATPQAPMVDEKIWPAVIAAAISAAPSIYQAVRGKDFQPTAEMATPQAPVVDEKMLHILPAILPGIVQAYRSKGFQASGAGEAPAETPEADEKFWGQVIAAAISAAPGVINAVRGKEFQAATQSSMVGVATPQAPVADEKFWGAVVAAAISAAPSIYQAVRGKEFQPGY